MSFTVDHCAVRWCNATVDLDWSAVLCLHGVVICERCRFEDACQECADAEVCS